MVPRHILNEVTDRLAPLPQGRELREAVEGLAKKHLVGVATVYRWANQAGLRWRKERAGKGNGKVNKDNALMVGALLQVTRRLTNSVSLPACDAVEILQDSGFLTKDVSTSTCLRALREHEASARHIVRPTPYRDLYAEHPNHVHGFDVTNCLQWDFGEKKGMTSRDTEMLLYSNKVVKEAKKIRRELLRYVLVDKASGSFYFRYYYAAGEKAADGMDFLYHAWRPKENEQYRFHGVPKMLYCDRGSIVHAHAVKNMLGSLKVQLETHMPGNPRAKGLVEGMMHYINRFEAMLKTQRPKDLEELNAWALDWAVGINAIKDFRKTGASRSALFNYITTEQLRLCPDWETLSTRIRTAKTTRVVNGNLTVLYEGLKYRLPDSAQVNRRVTVSYNPYAYAETKEVEIETETGEVYRLQPIETDVFNQRRDEQAVKFGEFKGITHPPTQVNKKEMEDIAESWNITFKGAADKRRAEAPAAGQESPLKFFGHQAEKVGNISFMDKKGTEIELTAKSEPRRIPFIKFMQALAESAGRRITKQEYAALKAELGESVAEDMLGAIAVRLKGKVVQDEEILQEKKIAHWRAQ